MDNPDYLKDLFNALKNQTRLLILQAIANRRYSVSQLQQELKRAGRSHSQVTVSEYLKPLMSVGLASETRDEYYASTFGVRLNELLGCFSEFAQKIPANSECYEETLLQSMLLGSKTFEDVEAVIAPKIVSRTLKRLRVAGLVKASKERSYIFFFKSKRDPNKNALTVSEQKIYDAVTYGGLSAGELAKDIGLSKRVTYRYLRRLRGKKLVFYRRIPKSYVLTSKGEKLAFVLQNFQQLVEETWESSQQVMQDAGGVKIKIGGLTNNAFLR